MLLTAEAVGNRWKMCCVRAQRFALINTDATTKIQPRKVFSVSDLLGTSSCGPHNAAIKVLECCEQARFSVTPPSTSSPADTHLSRLMSSKRQQSAVKS